MRVDISSCFIKIRRTDGPLEHGFWMIMFVYTCFCGLLCVSLLHVFFFIRKWLIRK